MSTAELSDGHKADLDFMKAIRELPLPQLTRMLAYQVTDWRWVAIKREIERRKGASRG